MTAIRGLLPIFIDRTLHREGHYSTFHAHHEGGDGLWREIPLARFLRAHSRARRRLHTTLPIHVNGGDRLQRHMYGPIDGRPGTFQNPDDAKGLIAMFGKTDAPRTMRDDNGLPNV